MTDKEREESLIQSNMGLVIKIAQSFTPRNPLELDDFIQLGRIGLWKAIKKYDPSRAKLCTYAWFYIKGEISRHITKEHKHKNRFQNRLNTATVLEVPPKESVWDYVPSTLTKSERFVIEKRLENYTFQQIADELGGFTKGWANKLYKRAIMKIQKENEEKTYTSV